jgi:glycerophosphoryl diester phosphodiesterase
VDIAARVREPVLPVLVVAHRGDSQNAPENTLAAFSLAIDSGAHAIEFDVQQCATGEMIVIHDDKVDRTTDGKGEVHKLSKDALGELSAGAWFGPEFKDERPPSLDEVLDLMRGQAVPMVEIKAKRKRSGDAGLRVARALERHGMAEQAVVICRELTRVEEVLGESARVPIAYLTFTKRQTRNATKIEGVRGVDCYWKSLSLRLVETVRKAGCFITPWTVNRVQDMDRLMLLGCESIISDCPVTLRDRIEAFEFERTEELHERFLRGETDLDLEQVAGGVAPDEVARQAAADSEMAMDVDWPEDPPE